MKQKKIKMAYSKKPRFPAPPILNIFSWNFYCLVLGLVELIDAKGILMGYSRVQGRRKVWKSGCASSN